MPNPLIPLADTHPGVRALEASAPAAGRTT